MTLLIIFLVILGYLLIATGHLTGVNKAAIAMFVGTVGWVVYICWGADFVMRQHPADYAEFLGGQTADSLTVKYFIYDHIFLKYVGKAAAVVMFLLATMQIIEILNNNGCFDFISELLRTRGSARLLWTSTAATFVISANLDNLTTTTMMLVVMHQIVKNRRQRMLIGSCIVLAATAGGCFTVIGDPTSLLLWGMEAVTASHFSAWLALPALVAWIVPTALVARLLPARLDTEFFTPPYRGDDTRLNRWQRLLMLFVGIGGLWFIPTFHNITKLSPFLGALCVLSVLWVVNEAFNRRLMQADQMFRRQIPRVLQYGAMQQILFVMGIMLAMGVMVETGIVQGMAAWADRQIGNLWLLALLSGFLSSIIDTFTIAATDIALYPLSSGDYGTNGIYWKAISYATAIGGCMLSVGSASGLALMKMEHIRLSWYLKTISPRVLAGFLLGLLLLYAEWMIA